MPERRRLGVTRIAHPVRPRPRDCDDRKGMAKAKRRAPLDLLLRRPHRRADHRHRRDCSCLEASAVVASDDGLLRLVLVERTGPRQLRQPRRRSREAQIVATQIVRRLAGPRGEHRRTDLISTCASADQSLFFVDRPQRRMAEWEVEERACRHGTSARNGNSQIVRSGNDVGRRYAVIGDDRGDGQVLARQDRVRADVACPVGPRDELHVPFLRRCPQHAPHLSRPIARLTDIELA